jgi:transcriptional regulator with XRE-family HTH domain
VTPGELKAARKTLGLSQSGLAEALRLSPANGDRTIRLWETGGNTIPGPAQVAVECLLERKAINFGQGFTTMETTISANTPKADPKLVMIGKLMHALECLAAAAAATPNFASPMILRDAQQLLAWIDEGIGE